MGGIVKLVCEIIVVIVFCLVMLLLCGIVFKIVVDVGGARRCTREARKLLNAFIVGSVVRFVVMFVFVFVRFGSVRMFCVLFMF